MSLSENNILIHTTEKGLQLIAEKVFQNKRLSNEEGLMLYQQAPLGFLGMLANYVREKKNGDYAYFNRNIHIEPTNICIYKCHFCAYSRKKGEPDSWEYSIEEMVNMVKAYIEKNITEVHIVGGVHPNRDIWFYGELIKQIKSVLPKVHVKAFTAVELDYMIVKANMSIEEGFKILKSFGLDSIPGGGAEIFNQEIRKQVCHEKSTAEKWLTIHKIAHLAGIQSNATMLYGHIEKYHHRIEHMEQLRLLQDETGGFNAFIPLKFRKNNNFLSYLGEISVVEDLRNYAVSRLYLDNIPHIKAYWPMIGAEIAQLALSYGVDDIDGTIDDSTKIYSMAGVKTKNSLNTEELIALVKQAKRTPVERDSLYNIIKIN